MMAEDDAVAVTGRKQLEHTDVSYAKSCNSFLLAGASMQGLSVSFSDSVLQGHSWLLPHTFYHHLLLHVVSDFHARCKFTGSQTPACVVRFGGGARNLQQHKQLVRR